MNRKLYEICKDYATKIHVGLPLTVDNVLNAVVDWASTLPVGELSELEKKVNQINDELPALGDEYIGYKIVVDEAGTAMKAVPDTASKVVQSISLVDNNAIVSLTYDSTHGIAMTTEGSIVYNDGQIENIQVEHEIPIVAGDGISIDATENDKQIEVKVVDRLPATRLSGVAEIYDVSKPTNFTGSTSFNDTTLNGVVYVGETQGAAGQVLTAKADGKVEWKTPATPSAPTNYLPAEKGGSVATPIYSVNVGTNFTGNNLFTGNVTLDGVVLASDAEPTAGQVLTAKQDGTVEWATPSTQGQVDSVPTQGSTNPVSSGAVFTALQGKLNATRQAVSTVGGLVKPLTTPTTTELVGISTAMEQERVKIGNGLSYDNTTNTLSAIGGGTGGTKLYQHYMTIKYDVIDIILVFVNNVEAEYTISSFGEYLTNKILGVNGNIPDEEAPLVPFSCYSTDGDDLVIECSKFSATNTTKYDYNTTLLTVTELNDVVYAL